MVLGSQGRLVALAMTSMAGSAAAEGPGSGPGSGPSDAAPGHGPDAEQLKECWAEAYEAWIAPPGTTSGEVLYFRPAAGVEECGAPSPSIEEAVALGERHGGLFGLTAFNPMGQDQPHEVNMERSSQLQAEIEALCKASGGIWWRSFGFDKDWHEKGFTVAGPEAEVVALARKYRQGAVYRFSRASQNSDGASGVCRTAMLRSTVPVLLEDTDADVLLAQTSRPAIEQADPLWVPM